MKLNAKQLRSLKKVDISHDLDRNPIYFILEDVLDTYNIGGIFRLADALLVKKIYLCGQTETPPNSRILKASVCTYKVVPWEYKKTAKQAIKDLKNVTSYTLHVPFIVAVEQDKHSIDYTKAKYKFPIALIFGNETYGVKKETLRLADQIIEIPMWGMNKSLNVIVSAAITSYWIVNNNKQIK